MVYQLNFLVCPVVREAVVDHNIETVPLRPHVDEKSERVTHMDGTGNSGSW